jgi:hypothetical protein
MPATTCTAWYSHSHRVLGRHFKLPLTASVLGLALRRQCVSLDEGKSRKPSCVYVRSRNGIRHLWQHWSRQRHLFRRQTSAERPACISSERRSDLRQWKQKNEIDGSVEEIERTTWEKEREMGSPQRRDAGIDSGRSCSSMGRASRRSNAPLRRTRCSLPWRRCEPATDAVLSDQGFYYRKLKFIRRYG